MKKENVLATQEEVFEEEKTAEMKKQEKKAQKAAAKKEEKPRTLADFKKRVSKARHKAEAVGVFYLLFTILLAGVVVLPVYVGTSGTISILNFWKPFMQIQYIKNNLVAVVLGMISSLFYLFVVLSVVVNVFKAFGCLGKLYKKKPSRQNGYNRNAQAMQELGKIFSGSFAAIVVFGFLMNIFAGVTVTPIFWVIVLVAIIVHFWLGLVSGNVSFFEVGKNTEIKRVGGRFAPFIRNVFQLIVVALIIYYFMQISVVTNLFKLLEKNAINALKADMTVLLVYVVLPAVQILMMIWIISMFRHAINPSEFHHDGKKAPGRLTFRWMAFLLLVTAAGAFAVTYYVSTKAIFPLSLGSVYIAVLAFAALLEELCMCRLPNDRANYIVEYDTPAKQENVCCLAAGKMACAGYHVPLNCITEPGVFMQPNGQPIMIMPMIAGARPMPQMAQPQAHYSYEYTNPYQSYAAEKPFDPYHQSKNFEPTPIVSAAAEKKEDLVKGEGVGMSKDELYNQAMREYNVKQLTEKWIGMASRPVPREEDEAASYNYAKDNPYVSQYSSAQELTEEDLKKPLPAKNWTISCPDCDTKLFVQEGSYAYRCPDCGCVFQLNKVIKPKQENNN